MFDTFRINRLNDQIAKLDVHFVNEQEEKE